KMRLVGSNNDSSAGSKFKSVKSLVRKFVFHIDNVTTEMTGDDISNFLKDQKVDVMSCFEAKSWMHFPASSEESDDTNLCKCNAFRVCVNLQDKSVVINADMWPAGVLIR